MTSQAQPGMPMYMMAGSVPVSGYDQLVGTTAPNAAAPAEDAAPAAEVAKEDAEEEPKPEDEDQDGEEADEGFDPEGEQDAEADPEST